MLCASSDLSGVAGSNPREGVWRFWGAGKPVNRTSFSLPVPPKAPFRPLSCRREQRQTTTHSPFLSLEGKRSNNLAREQ